MLGTALYHPHIDIRDGGWLRSAVLFWDEIRTIVPPSISNPYESADSKICEQEGYLRPLRCDLHPDLIENLGKRVMTLLENQEWQRGIGWNGPEDPASATLMQANEIGNEMNWRLEQFVGIHPEKLSPALRSILFNEGGVRILSSDKFPPNIRDNIRDFDIYEIHPEKLSFQIRPMFEKFRRYEDGEWVMVSGVFARIYMSALASLLSEKIDASPLTNEQSSSGVSLRCLLDDVTVSGEATARGALVSVVMKALKVDPNAPINSLISFRRSNRDQLAELSGLFDDLKGKIETSTYPKEIEENSKRLFENKIQPGLYKLKRELENNSIQTVWDGITRTFTVSAASGGALAYITGYTGPMLLGAAAFIALADVGMKSYSAASKTRRSSPYTYLLDVERKFSLPRS